MPANTKTPTTPTPRRKRCLNCPKWFVPRARRADKKNRGGGSEQKFCSAKCRIEFHNAGNTAFGPLRTKIPRMIANEVKRAMRDDVITYEHFRRVVIAMRQEYRREIATATKGAPTSGEQGILV